MHLVAKRCHLFIHIRAAYAVFALLVVAHRCNTQTNEMLSICCIPGSPRRWCGVAVKAGCMHEVDKVHAGQRLAYTLSQSESF